MSAMMHVDNTNDDEIAEEDLIDPALVIEPPPEMKTIIEKTVSFVVKNGIEFESKVRESQRSNRKFDFLNIGHAFHNYYKQKYQIAKYPAARELAEKYRLKKEKLHSSQCCLLGLTDNNNRDNMDNNDKSLIMSGNNIIAHKLTLKQRIKQQLALSLKPKSQYIVQSGYSKFIVPLPTKRISSYEIDVIKLVAQFTACIGKSFIRDLQRGEPDNETFGFLSPMHPRFQYFQRLVDAYSNIIDQFEDYKDFINKFKSLNLDRDKIWYQAIGNAEWTNGEKEKEAKYLKDEEDERRANALIDWQTFTVLDTIDFDGDMDGHLVPPGRGIEEIDAILDTTLDVEADINEPILAHDREEDMDISESDEDEEDDDEEKEEEEQVVNINDIEMEQEKSELHRKQIAKAKVALKLNKKPMPAREGVIVTNDLDIIPTERIETDQDIELRLKLEKILNDSRNEQLENQQCPICNEYINIKHLSQHIRIELLDPKWKEQKESLKVRLSQTTLASNQQISENLMKFSREHAAQLGVKQNIINNNNNNTKPQWDGHKDSLIEQKKLAALHDEIEKQQKKEKEKEKQEKEKKDNNNNNNIGCKSDDNNNNKINESQQTQQPPPPQPQYPPIQHTPYHSHSHPHPPPHPHHHHNPHHPSSHHPHPPPPPPHHPHHHHPPHPPHPHHHHHHHLNPFIINTAIPPPPTHFRSPHPHHQHHHAPPPHHPTMLPPHHPLHHHPHPPHSHSHHQSQPQPPPPPPPYIHQQQQQQQQHQQQPPIKKQKLNDGSSNDLNRKQPDGLISEQQFINENGGINNNIKIRIKVPKDDKKKQFKFNGQTLTFTMKLNENINQLKQRINTVLSLPTNKQKLRIQSNGIWVKDSCSLAFYNINSKSILELATRTRGGKKNK